MKIHLDSDRCQGHGRCYSIAPALFTYDDNGQAALIVTDELADEQVGLAQLAANNCPEYAIEVA
ncbi:MAG: ferredoxin [Actinobacteria bacterium]|nr:ferredoxin [Actinomycetota bacterium]